MSISEKENDDALSFIDYALKNNIFLSQNEIADAIGTRCYSVSNWTSKRCRVSRKCYVRLMDIKRQVEETGKYSPPKSVVAGRDVVSGNATVNNADASTMWKDYQGRMINAVLKSDLPFDVQTKVISIIVNA